MGDEGIFLTIEGIEGAGKTTQAELLTRSLRSLGREVILTQEPGGGGRVGTTLRRLLKDPSIWRELGVAEIYLYAAARAHHIESLIAPALARGAVVICDRYLDSTRAYQGHGRERSSELIEELHALPPLTLRPRRTLLLDLPPQLGLERACRRARTDDAGYDEESVAFFHRVRGGFEAIAAEEPERISIIDASEPAERVHERVCEALHDLFPSLAPVAGTDE